MGVIEIGEEELRMWSGIESCMTITAFLGKLSLGEQNIYRVGRQVSNWAGR